MEFSLVIMLRSYICKNKFGFLIDLCLSVIDFCLENVSLMYISDGDPKGEKRQHSSFFFSKSALRHLRKVCSMVEILIRS